MASMTEVQNKMITLQNQKVILDCDVAELYGVETKRINEAVNNNPEKFPEGYVKKLNDEEILALRSKISTLKKASRGKHSKYPPKAFTEKGLYMLATILKSPKAVETTLAIVEAYAKLRELSRVMTDISQKEENSEEQKTLVQYGGQLMEDLMMDVLPIQSSETSFELNLAMFKLKHSVKRENDEELKKLREEVAQLKQKIRQLE